MSRSFRVSRISSLTAALALCLGAHAQSPAPAAAAEKPFTLEEAIAIALRGNFGLQQQALTVENAKETILIQDAAFDPTITASTRGQSTQAVGNFSTLESGSSVPRDSNSITGSVGASQRVAPTNGTVSVNTGVSRRADNSTNNLLNPQYAQTVTLNVNQPLLRDAGRRAATAALERAKLGLTITTIGYRSAVLTLISDTENAYYNVVAARESLRIRQLTLERIQLLLDENQARRTSGVATDLDVLTAEVNVANARRALIQQEQAVRDAEDRLLNLINAPSLDVRPGPVAFADYTEGAPNFAQSYKAAREYYPDTLSQIQTIKQFEIDLATAKRNTLPTLDLTGGVTYNSRPDKGNLQQAIANLPNDHGQDWNVGLNYSMPWGQKADKARYRQAQNNLSNQKIRLEQLEQQLMVNVRSAVRAVEFNLAAVEVAAKAVEGAARQYDQQKARYDAGLSTSRIVVQFQEDLENARFNELSAKLALRRAVAELRRLEGSSISRYRIELPPAVK